MGHVDPQKFLFVENSGEIPETSGTKVSTPLFTTELSDFLPKKKHFWSSASVLSMKSPVVTYRQVFNAY